MVGAAILTGDPNVGDLGGQAAQLALASYSRNQESEADMLGIRYLARTGYDPDAMSSFLSQLEAHKRLEAAMAGRPGAADQFDFLQTHPRTADRVRDAAAQAGVTAVREPMRNQETYLRKIDGMVYGDSAKQGFVRGQRFAHPVMRFAFEVPDGFNMINLPSKVVAQHRNGSLIQFDAVPPKISRQYDEAVFLQDVWAKGLRLRSMERITINGLPAATGTARVNTRSGPADLRLLAIRFAPDRIFRFLFLTPGQQTAAMNLGLRETTYSFRRLSAAEAAALKPYRIRIHEVRAGDTVSGLARRMPFDGFREERFRLLNGMQPGEALQRGRLVKLVVEE